MSGKIILITILTLAAAIFISCSDQERPEEATDGKLGGKCIEGKCDDGLQCIDDVCAEEKSDEKPDSEIDTDSAENENEKPDEADQDRETADKNPDLTEKDEDETTKPDSDENRPDDNPDSEPDTTETDEDEPVAEEDAAADNTTEETPDEDAADENLVNSATAYLMDPPSSSWNYTPKTIIKLGLNKTPVVAYWTALRFIDIQVPKGATITSAKLSFFPSNDVDNSKIRINIYGEKKADSKIFDITNYDSNRPDQRSKTAVKVPADTHNPESWRIHCIQNCKVTDDYDCPQRELDCWNRETKYTAPHDLSTIIQEKAEKIDAVACTVIERTCNRECYCHITIRPNSRSD